MQNQDAKGEEEPEPSCYYVGEDSKKYVVSVADSHLPCSKNKNQAAEKVEEQSTDWRFLAMVGRIEKPNDTTRRILPATLEPCHKLAKTEVLVLCEKLGKGNKALLRNFLLHSSGGICPDDDIAK